MSAHYDTYDYPSYWVGREYEHEAEMHAMKSFLKRIPKIRTILEIGSGYGRLVPSYLFRAKKIILADPSAKLLKLARNNLKNKRINFLHTNIENLHPKIRRNSVDLVIFVRVLHHIQDLDIALSTISKITKKKGYLILEFANKRHLKATLSEFLHGNFTFPLDIFPKEIKNPRKKAKCIAFYNYHPDAIKEKIEHNGYSIVEIRSVSNIRSTLMKKICSKETLLFFEKILQKPLSHIYFGPSIFVLAKRKF
jgi:ubiquinone/menaquinone biosynthesis C-methylase UbiE